eukprot:TRINITY_DN7221_c0_g1_i2.p1 TRINITY_DN7221_c0_g1~~TRINITY_DN7221_c0_g1_i2.p1  ORF type:complete len:123 (-),score=16.92 TRINITY_DN7221_c0_g1_i2:331-699(-)
MDMQPMSLSVVHALRLDPITQGLDPVTQGAVPYYGLGYGGYHYGKRSADAEPKADAAYLGYGYPYAYGGYGYAAHVPFGSSTGLDPITQGLDPYVGPGVLLPLLSGLGRIGVTRIGEEGRRS